MSTPEDLDSHGESLEDIATFLSGVEAFRTLGGDQLSRVAAAVTHRDLRAGETMIVEGGHPSTQLWVLRDGALDLLRRDHLVTVMTSRRAPRLRQPAHPHGAGLHGAGAQRLHALLHPRRPRRRAAQP